MLYSQITLCRRRTAIDKKYVDYWRQKERYDQVSNYCGARPSRIQSRRRFRHSAPARDRAHGVSVTPDGILRMRLSEAGRGMAGGLFVGAIVGAIAVNTTGYSWPTAAAIDPDCRSGESSLGRHSQRSARTGSIRVARRAGTALARATAAHRTRRTAE